MLTCIFEGMRVAVTIVRCRSSKSKTVFIENNLYETAADFRNRMIAEMA